MVRTKFLWSALLVLFALLAVGCAPRTGAGENGAAAGSELVVDLPALVIDIDLEGTASMGGVPVDQLGAAVGASLAGLSLPAEQVQSLVAAGISQVEIGTAATGLNLLVNGQPIPSLTWDAASITNLTDLLAKWPDAALGPVGSLLPLLTDLGAGVTLRFPAGDGAAAAVDTAAVAAAQAAFLATAGSPARINLPINYNADGSFNIGSISGEAFTLATGLPLESLALPPERLALYQSVGIETFTVQTDSEGIHLGLNGQPLPMVSWGDGRLAYALQLAVQAGLVGGSEGGSEGDSEALSGLIQQLLPILQTAEVTVNVVFPPQ